MSARYRPGTRKRQRIHEQLRRELDALKKPAEPVRVVPEIKPEFINGRDKLGRCYH